MFPEGKKEGLYHTADATLWFFHAIDRYREGHRRPCDTAPAAAEARGSIVEHHLRGTRFGIGVDPEDGLLRQGEEGYQLTWMDAKVDDWVVTPRRGKAVEINALWYNALRLLEGWLRDEGGCRGRDDRTNTPERAQDIIQPAILERGGRLPVRRGGRRAGRRSGVPAEPDSRHFARASGAGPRAMGSGVHRDPRSPADASRTPLTRSRTSRLQGSGTTATFAPAMPPITREPSGAG